MTTKQQRQALQDQDLHAFLNGAFPEFRTKQRVFDVPGFATAIGMSAEGVYKWLRTDRVSPDGARKVIALSKTHKRPLKSEDLTKYVLG